MVTNNVRTFKTNKKKKPKQPGKNTGSIGKKKRWKNNFEKGVYLDVVLDWKKSKAAKQQDKTKDSRNKVFSLVDPDIVSEYIRLKNKTETPYSL